MRNHSRRAEYGRYIDQQVEKTGRQVKLTEIFGGLFLLVVGLLVFFLAAAIIDHWIVPLRALGRWGLLLLLIGGVVAFVVLRLLPLVFRRVNPIYSAHTIERQAPEMKNSLVNHLVLRQSGQGVSKGVRRAVEEQAAQRLSQTSVDSAVDRGRVIRLGYLLLALTAVAALYKFLSPKDPLATFGRIAAPWSDIDAPTRVVIEQVRHNANSGDSANSGDAAAGDPSAAWVYADQKPVQVDASVRGLASGEPVTLYWSTEDGRVDKQPIVMRPQGDDGRQFRCHLPDEHIGLRQDVRFFVAAGDARSAEFRIEVRTPPVIAVKSVEYRYPAYTGKQPETRVGGGDIAALVGTTVTLHAQANQAVKSATVDLGCDGNIDYTMQVAGQVAGQQVVGHAARVPGHASRVSHEATATFRLASYPPGKSPGNYLVRMTNAQGHENPQPIRYNLEIVSDRPPTVRIVQPAARELQLPLNGSLPIVVEARDADFALFSVHVTGAPADSASNLLFNAPIFEEAAGGFTKEFGNGDSPFEFRPQGKQLGRELKVGDVVHLWAVARDNKHNLKDELEPNVVLSEKLIVHITAPTEQPRDKMQTKDQGDKKEPGASKEDQPKDKKQDEGAKKQSEKKQSEKKQDGGKQGKDKSKEKQAGDKSNEKKSGGSDSKQPDQKQQGDKQDGKSKDGSKSEGGPKDMSDLFKELHREAQQKKKEQEKADGAAGKQKGAGSDSPPPDGAKSPQEKSPQPGSGSNKKPGKKTKADGGSDSPGETVEPMTADPGSATKGQPNDSVGKKKSGNDSFSGATSKKGNDTPSADPPASNPSKEAPKEDEATPGKASKMPSKLPDANPKSNPKAKGDAGAAKAANPGEAKKKEEPSDSGNEKQKGGNPRDDDSATGSANKTKRDTGSPPSLSDTTKKKNNKAIEKKRSSEETPKDAAVAPSVNSEQGKNTNESGTNDGDQKGGSKEGGGARGNKQGGGQGGTNTDSDEGRGAGSSDGPGETGKAPGTKVKADRPTGSSGNETGDGSDTTAGNKNPGAAKSPSDPSQAGSDAEGGSAGSGGKQDPSGGRGLPETGPGSGKREFGKTQPTEPDLEAAKKAIDLVLDHIKDHPDEARFQEPQVIELANRLRALRDASDRGGPDGDVARRQLRSLSHGFSTRGLKRDTLGGFNELRGARDLPGYSQEYLERSGTRPARKVP